MPRLRRTSPSQPGWTRRRVGTGFVYLDEDGRRLDPDLTARCKALVIPPAWQDVWICPFANGHLQAVGTDAAGRRQYLYHPHWRERRDADKFDRVRQLAAKLPAARTRAGRDLALTGMPRPRALAAAFGLLDHGLFRIGGEDYAEENGSFGLATLRREHVTVRDGAAHFDYVAKSGVPRAVVVREPAVVQAVAAMRRRRGGGEELLAYKDGGQWRDVVSADITDYVKATLHTAASAKDFRTWHGTVLAAVGLAERAHEARSATARARIVRATIRAVAEDLGNTPAVARRSYVDPLVLDRFDDGETIAPALARIGPRVPPPRRRERIERAVLRLLSG